MKDHEAALVYGTLSTITLPLGAACGILFSKASDETLALMVAFGAGALLFAVTVELYGDAIERLERQGFERNGTVEILITLGGAVIGSLLYIALCRWLDTVVIELDTPREPFEPCERLRASTTPLRGKKRAVFNVLTGANRTTADRPEWYDQGFYGALSERTHASSPTPQSSEPALSPLGPAALAPKNPHFPDSEGVSEMSVQDTWKKVADIRVAMGIWFGVLLDGIPEAMMLGYLAAEKKLSLALITALLIANFPEAFSSAALVKRHRIEDWKILSMWTFLCVFTGGIACLTAYILPSDLMEQKESEAVYKPRYFWVGLLGALIEGMAGGAMLACITNVMLPDAFKRQGDFSGIFVLMGFIVAALVKVFGGAVNNSL